MGNTDTKLNFRKSVVQLTTRTQPVDANDEAFWSQFWSESATCIQDVFTLIPAAEIRALREESPSNLATLCYKAVEKLVQVAESGCRSVKDEQTVQNCIRLLIRILPYIFEDPDWRGFFWSTLPGHKKDDNNEDGSIPLAQSLITALCDLLFCPDFTVGARKKSGPDNPEDMTSIDSCEYIWASGVGFTHNPPSTATYDQNRTEILKLLLTCFSETMYFSSNDSQTELNQWIAYFTSTENRHALPLFTSLLNVVCSYDPVGYGLPYNYLMFSDFREPLVEVALHVLCVTLDGDYNTSSTPSEVISGSPTPGSRGHLEGQFGGSENLFINYLSRIHREEDFAFMLKGLTRLLNNPLMQTYLPGSCKKIQFNQELLVFLWKICDINKKFMFYVLKSSDVLDVLVPILFYLNDARSDQSRVGLMHIGVFILLLLSGERNFGVRLNKPYSVRVPMDIPVFTGSHADLLIIVFHKIITTGHQRLQPLFDCLLTIIVNVSPYLKTLSMVASAKLLHLLEAFSTPWFLFASPSNHHLMFFLLEVFNNIIQYQFDGNSNLVYTIIRKRQIFHQLASLPTDHASIAKALTRSTRKLSKGAALTSTPQTEDPSMEGSVPAAHAEPGTLQASLAATPALTSRFIHSIMEDEDVELYGSIKKVRMPETSKKTSSSVLRRPSTVDDRMFSEDVSTKNDELKSSVNLVNVAEVNGGMQVGGGAQGAVPLYELANQVLQQSNGSQQSYIKRKLAEMIGIEKMTEKSPASNLTTDQTETNPNSGPPSQLQQDPKYLNISTNAPPPSEQGPAKSTNHVEASSSSSSQHKDTMPAIPDTAKTAAANLTSSNATSRANSIHSNVEKPRPSRKGSSSWLASPEWVQSWKQKLPLQTIMRLLQVLVPQVEKICIDKGLTDESEILKFLQHGTLVGLLPVPHPILIRKYQTNSGTTMWFRTYMWGIIYLRNVDPPIWYDTDVKLFEIQRV